MHNVTLTVNYRMHRSIANCLGKAAAVKQGAHENLIEPVHKTIARLLNTFLGTFYIITLIYLTVVSSVEER